MGFENFQGFEYLSYVKSDFFFCWWFVNSLRFDLISESVNVFKILNF